MVFDLVSLETKRAVLLRVFMTNYTTLTVA